MDSDRIHLIHINECLGRIAKYVEGGRGAFMGSTQVQDAVMWNLAIMSRSARLLSDVQKRGHPEVDWSGLCHVWRNFAHDPTGADPDEVWQEVERTIPALRQQMMSILVAVRKGV